MKLRCLDVARAELGQPLKLSGAEYYFRCRNHDDVHPSLAVNDRKNRWLCGPCGKGGGPWALGAFLAGLNPSEKLAVATWLRERGLLPRTRNRAVLTIEDLGTVKRLPVDFLINLGLEGHPKGVRITYRLRDGTSASRYRIRTSVTARKGSFWNTSTGPIVPYGLDRLGDARRAEFLVIAEGESDPWTLWFHEYPSLGLPGAQMASKLEAEHLTGIPRLYVIQEPGDGGAAFAAGVARRLREIKWVGEAYRVVLGDVKDPNDLHKKDPDGFKAAFQQALENAERLPQSLPETASPSVDPIPSPYRETDHGLVWVKRTRDSEMAVPLTNFTAHILADFTLDDGAEVQHPFEMEATLHAQTVRFKSRPRNS